MSQSVGTEIYSGLASFGEIRALMGLIIGGLICLLILGIGIYMLTTLKKSEKTMAIITDVSCGIPSKGNYTCNVTYKYTVNGQSYDGNFPTYISKVPLKIGDSFEIYYEVDNPSLSDNNDKKTIAIIMTVVGVVILLLLIGNYYFATKSKGYAAFTGASGILSSFSSSGSNYNNYNNQNSGFNIPGMGIPNIGIPDLSNIPGIPGSSLF